MPEFESFRFKITAWLYHAHRLISSKELIFCFNSTIVFLDKTEEAEAGISLPLCAWAEDFGARQAQNPHASQSLGRHGSKS